MVGVSSSSLLSPTKFKKGSRLHREPFFIAKNALINNKLKCALLLSNCGA